MDVFFSSTAKASRRSKLFFLKQYLRNPFTVGAVAPSSQKLAQLIVKMLAPQASDVVVELGPGTGVFTRELLSQGVAPANLISVEFNAEFVKFLQGEFPAVRIVEGAAQDLPQLLKALGQGPVKKIISGIPLRSMKPSMRDQIAKLSEQRSCPVECSSSSAISKLHHCRKTWQSKRVWWGSVLVLS